MSEQPKPKEEKPAPIINLARRYNKIIGDETPPDNSSNQNNEEKDKKADK